MHTPFYAPRVHLHPLARVSLYARAADARATCPRVLDRRSCNFTPGDVLAGSFPLRKTEDTYYDSYLLLISAARPNTPNN